MSGTGLRSPRHFIVEHRCDLVERISLVEPLVDILRQEDVLNQGEYETIRAGETRAEQARRLLDAVIHKGRKAMDVLQEALWQQDPYLMKELHR
ncbi:apoptosis-associated speck-like protein containing a CARD [Carcharodon carcharias]|uniref:apoptosis-associated speck-like protein containing a CARD n=1 Tax=Carcharodon carcharias TaxID=13397 RepID=UPI001B7F4CC8|nr:apoptosis-associated speck-like protein containing a CARD [Carcharodon carcharias]XP_041049934.1 apoptosis-associated speck-like protein containing a CARD [Carcharodon carcharias]XP_041049935.1 apoptosis-associated speck-like protein containing a CARD [Carcharodon carcharias]XP_041049936.1 apoptosis-associated speck-like protein containing a CARD [Carcharodon carcharias]